MMVFCMRTSAVLVGKRSLNVANSSANQRKPYNVSLYTSEVATPEAVWLF